MSNFVKCTYSLAQDQYKNLSLAAIGMWHFLMNQKRNWELTPESIANRNVDDLETIKKVLRELADKKILEISQKPDGEINYKLKSSVTETATQRPALRGAGAGGRPYRNDYNSDEEFEKAFYEWNTVK